MALVKKIKSPLSAVWRHLKVYFAPVPLLAWLIGILVAVLLEYWIGRDLAYGLGLERFPVIFGFDIIFKKVSWIPAALLCLLLIYLIPTGLTAKLLAKPANFLADRLLRFPIFLSVLVHLALLYTILHIWSSMIGYRVIMLQLTLIGIMVTLSLNVINGYMGEFSCSHPGFMALGAYAASIFTIVLFTGSGMYGAARLPAYLGPWLFPLGLILGGIVAAVGALVVAIPSFQTRGDYLAIISLAFMFIVKSLIENLEIVGGPRGLSGQPDYAGLLTVFIWTAICVWVINNFVNSTLGKALNAVRDDEIAAEAMTVNTRRTKIVAFLFAAFWAGVAGGLFAHVLRSVYPVTFGIQQLADVLAMVYFGGLNSVYGSIVGAVSINLISEALRALQIWKWIIIPLLLILMMIFRPTGLIAFKQFDVLKLISPKKNNHS